MSKPTRARLECAAPAMYRALKRVMDRADRELKTRYGGRRSAECQADYDACVAAIALAEGRAHIEPPPRPQPSEPFRKG